MNAIEWDIINWRIGAGILAGFVETVHPYVLMSDTSPIETGHSIR
jgi:hypothetical protein